MNPARVLYYLRNNRELLLALAIKHPKWFSDKLFLKTMFRHFMGTELNLNNPKTFGTEHPFPTLSADDSNFSEDGNGYCGSVMPAFNFMVIKGLEKYGHYELARECAIRHLYFVLEGLMPNEDGMYDSKTQAPEFQNYVSEMISSRVFGTFSR